MRGNILRFIRENELIKPGSTLVCAVSGGKDSLTLLVLLAELRKYYPKRFELEALTVDMGLDGMDFSPVAALCAQLDVPYTCKHTQIGPIIFDYRKEKNPCSMCAKMRRGALNDLIAEPSFAALLEKHGMSFTVNPSYRHIAVLKTGSDKVETTPPHDILTRPIAQYLPKGEGDKMLREIMSASWRILKKHPINNERRAAGKMPANSLWFWGQGSAVQLDEFEKKYGHSGDAITAVPLVAGIAELAGLKHTPVDGATGEIDTNYVGKVQAALNALKKYDFAALHIEAPDECGHAGNAKEKVRAIELIDSEVFAPLLKGLDNMGERYRILFLSDHYTPICTRTHDGTPVPYLLYDSGVKTQRGLPYCEESAAAVGNRLEEGTALMPLLFGL